MELSILCDVEVTCVIKGANGKYHCYASGDVADALSDYIKDEGNNVVTSLANKDYNRQFKKSGDSEDDEEDKPKKKSVPKREKKVLKRERIAEDEDDKAWPSSTTSSSPATKEGAPINNQFANPPSDNASATTPGSGDSFAFLSSIQLPTPSWNPELESMMGNNNNNNNNSSGGSKSKDTVMGLSNGGKKTHSDDVGEGALISSKERKVPLSQGLPKKRKKPALSIDTSGTFTEPAPPRMDTTTTTTTAVSPGVNGMWTPTFNLTSPSAGGWFGQSPGAFPFTPLAFPVSPPALNPSSKSENGNPA